MAEYHPGKGEYAEALSLDERKGARAAVLYLKAQAGEHLQPDQLADLAMSVTNVELARQLGLIPHQIHQELNAAADSIYNLPKP